MRTFCPLCHLAGNPLALRFLFPSLVRPAFAAILRPVARGKKRLSADCTSFNFAVFLGRDLGLQRLVKRQHTFLEITALNIIGFGLEAWGVKHYT